MRTKAILNLYSSAVTVVNDGESVLDKDMNPITIDETKVAEEAKRLQAEYDNQAYARAREQLYPKIGDQLDDLYHKGAFSDEMSATIKKVKDDNPKP